MPLLGPTRLLISEKTVQPDTVIRTTRLLGTPEYLLFSSHLLLTEVCKIVTE